MPEPEQVVRPLARVKVLPGQGEGLADVKSDTIVKVAGWGAGKTEFIAMKGAQLAGINYPIPTGIFEPTYPMVKDILVPTLEGFFERCKIVYRYNQTAHDMHFKMAGRWHTLWLRSTDNPESAKGSNLGGVLMDEAGLHKALAWRYLPARARHPLARCPQFVAVGTPEFSPEFQDYAEGPWDERLRGKRHVIRAQTYDNTFLQPSPQEYVRRKLGHLDETDIDQYVRGLFVARGTRVYRAFRRDDLNVCAPCPPEMLRGQRIYVGCDFNVGKMVWVLAVRRGQEGMHVFGEVVTKDTDVWIQSEAMRQYLSQRLPDYSGFDIARRITMHVDPSAKNRHVAAQKSTVRELEGQGFTVWCNKEVIPVADRVMTVNARFRAKHLTIDPSCTELITSLEKQGRDKNGDPEKNPDPKADRSASADALGYCLWGFPHWRATVPRGNLESRQPTGYVG